MIGDRIPSVDNVAALTMLEDVAFIVDRRRLAYHYMLGVKRRVGILMRLDAIASNVNLLVLGNVIDGVNKTHLVMLVQVGTRLVGRVTIWSWRHRRHVSGFCTNVMHGRAPYIGSRSLV